MTDQPTHPEPDHIPASVTVATVSEAVKGLIDAGFAADLVLGAAHGELARMIVAR